MIDIVGQGLRLGERFQYLHQQVHHLNQQLVAPDPRDLQLAGVEHLDMHLLERAVHV